VGEAYPDGEPVYAKRAGGNPGRRIDGLGWNLKMTELQAAIGRVQARRLGRLVERRRHNGDYLARSLAGIREVAVPGVPPAAEVSWWRFPVRVLPGTDRDRVLARLRDQGITAYAPDYSVLPLQPAFGSGRSTCPRASQWHEQILLLPTHPNLAQRELRDVGPALRRVLRQERPV
jgi:perosamine synthetase